MPLENFIDFTIDKEGYKIMKTFKKDCKDDAGEFVTLSQKENDDISQGFCLPNKISPEMRETIRNSLNIDYLGLGGDQKRIII